MPDLGEGLEEGEIVEWLVAEGDPVELNQPLVEVETAKATVEIPSPFAGRRRVAARRRRCDGPRRRTPGDVRRCRGRGVAQRRSGSRRGVEQRRRGARRGRADDAAGPEAGEGAGGRPRRRWSARAPDGRVTAEDVRAAAGGGRGPTSAAPVPSRSAIAADLERQAAIPQVTTFRTLDCTALEAFRAELGVSPLPVVLAALCRDDRRPPALNAGWDDDGVVERRGRSNVGIAADTERGLVVPVLQDAPAHGHRRARRRDRTARAGGPRRVP